MSIPIPAAMTQNQANAHIFGHMIFELKQDLLTTLKSLGATKPGKELDQIVAQHLMFPIEDMINAFTGIELSQRDANNPQVHLAVAMLSAYSVERHPNQPTWYDVDRCITQTYEQLTGTSTDNHERLCALLTPLYELLLKVAPEHINTHDEWETFFDERFGISTNELFAYFTYGYNNIDVTTSHTQEVYRALSARLSKASA